MVSASRKPRFFYGWIIVVITWLANFTTTSTNPLVFAFFLVPMAGDLGLSRAQLVLGITFRMIAGGLFSPFLGRIVDRYGARWPGVISGCIVGISLVGFSLVSNVWVMYGLFILSGFSGFSIVGGNVLTIVPPANWFIAKRGRAIAISSSGQLLGSAAFALLAAGLIDSVGWRPTWTIFGIIAFLGVSPGYAIFMRRHPEDMGLLPDGADAPPAPVEGARAVSTHAPDHDFTTREALRTPVYWTNLASMTLLMFAITPFLLFRPAYWMELGFGPSLISSGVALDPFMFAAANILMGWYAERVPVRYFGVLGGLFRTVGMLPLALGWGWWGSVYVHNLVWGIGSGTTSVFQTMVTPEYFGRRHQGSIRGITTMVMVVISSLGGPVAGYLLDRGMDFNVLWWLILAAVILASGSFLLQKPPVHPLTRVADPARTTG